MSRTILITPAAIKALNPCLARWRTYRETFKGRKAHPLADLLTREGVSEDDLHADFLWLLDRLMAPRNTWFDYARPPASPIAAELWKRIMKSWLASPSLPPSSWLHHAHHCPAGCILGLDTPADWKERALAAIATMEAGEASRVRR